MRIIAGTHRGRVLAAVRGDGTRPTSDKIRGAIFSTLQSRFGPLNGTYVLDMFAGTGALSIEALSRGAEQALLIEKGAMASAMIQKNLKALRLEERARLIRGDSFKVLKQHFDRQFDIVFVDPPYDRGLACRALHDLASLGIVSRDGWVVVETGRQEQLPEAVESLHLVQQRVYGSTQVHYYVNQQNRES